MARSRKFYTLRHRIPIHSYWVDYPFFDFYILKLRRAYKRGHAHLGVGVRGAGLACTRLSYKFAYTNKLLTAYSLPFRHPWYNLSSTFKKHFTISNTLTPTAKLLPFETLEESQDLPEDFNIEMALIMQTKWVDLDYYDLSLWMNDCCYDNLTVNIVNNNKLVLASFYWLGLSTF